MESSKKSAYDNERLFEIDLNHDDKKTKINGASEYAFGMWTRWLRTVPKYLPKRSP